MKANYGYEDASGSYFITIDSSKCDGCSECVRACTKTTLNSATKGGFTADDLLPSSVLEIIIDDYEQQVASVNIAHRRRLRYSCAQCKAVKDKQDLPCVAACKPSAIVHSW